ncbi:HAD family hydrolase [Microvirga sp. GCM10011540]|uniref:HAD family hydrolase n=1 Tax=Microvirga sp. GCM10011540 TaxID=3317338 RepID=UPI00360E78DA
MAVVFDFDLTLAPGCLDALLIRCGEDPDHWRARHVAPLQENGWEEVLASIYALVNMSNSGSGGRITKELVHDVGRNLQPYPGVPDIFASLREVARNVVPDLEVEYFLVSSGYRDIMCATSIAHEFKMIWGTELHFSSDGDIAFPKLIVTHPEKVRYILALSKGLDPKGANAPAHVYRDVPAKDVYVPLDQIVYVGDGRSDMSVFQLLKDQGGIAIGLFKDKSQNWNANDRTDPRRRVQNLAPADFSDGSELIASLNLAVGSIARKIALRRLSRGE